MKSLISSLNPDQLASVKDTNHLVLVQAGPGTGKTLTLVAKIGWLLSSQVKPQKITAITFTRKASDEIKNRKSLFTSGLNSQQVNLGTFHSFALKFLKLSEADLVTETEQKIILQKLQPRLSHKLNSKDLLLIISRIKNNFKLLEQASAEIKKIYQLYQDELALTQKLDLDDLLLKLLVELKKPNFPKDQYLLVDEFQDVSPLQLQIVVEWAKKAKQVFLIGDPHQAIYGFRGASSDSFQKLEDHFYNISVHQLTKNYRSGADILTVAGRLFPQEKKLEAQVQENGAVQLIRTLNQVTEADWILQDIEEKIGGTGLISASDHHQQTGATLKEFAIVYRLHQLGNEVAKKLRASGLPYQKVGSESLYLTDSIQLVVKLWQLAGEEYTKLEKNNLWLEILSNKFLKISLSTLNRLISQQQTQKKDWAVFLNQVATTSLLSKQDLSGVRLVQELMVEIQQAVSENASLLTLLDSIQANLNLNQQQQTDWSQLRVDLLQFEEEPNQLHSFLSYYQKLETENFFDPRAEKISLLSMHATKGLEFDWVYLIGFEQGLVPMQVRDDSFLSVDLSSSNLEERNLFYVSLTRAKKGISLITAENRWRQKQKLSEFFSEISGPPLTEKLDAQMVKIKKKHELQQEKLRQGVLF